MPANEQPNPTDSSPGSGPAADEPYRAPEGAHATHIVRTEAAELRFDVVAEWMTLRKEAEPVAEIFHVAYLLSGADAQTRPIAFIFNGGPGASSAYLHIGALGPKRVVFDPSGAAPAPPARLVDNDDTWLQFVDLVFVDPVGTGFSRAVPPRHKQAKQDGGKKKPPGEEFFALNRDLDSLGEFIQRFLSKHGRWTSPVFVAGESYGGFRAAKLSRRLQEGFGVGLSGAILISPALEWSVLMPTDYELLHFVDTFPTMAAVAHFHGRSSAGEGLPPERVRAEAEAFATRELAELLVSGDRVDPARRTEILDRMAALCGVDRPLLDRACGRLRIERFARELLRDDERVLGLYDATVTARDPYPDRPDGEGPDPTLSAIERLFSAGINAHLRTTIGVDTDRDYRLLSLDVNKAWKLDTDQHVLERHVGATDDLRYALSLNPHMRVMISHGLFDLVTPYFASERLAAHMKLHAPERARLSLQHFPGGHMFYTRDASRTAFRGAAEQLVRAALPGTS